MIAGMVEETAEQKLKRHEDALVVCMAEITKLREEKCPAALLGEQRALGVARGL